MFGNLAPSLAALEKTVNQLTEQLRLVRERLDALLLSLNKSVKIS